MKKEEIVKFYKAHKLYIFPSVVAISSLFLIIFAIYPQTTKLLNNQQTVEGLTAKSKLLNTEVSALERYEGTDLSQKVAAALNTFPADKDFGNIFSLLQQVAADSGFVINSINVGNAASKTGASESFLVKLELKGSKMLLQNLLSNLENAPRLIRISNIDVSGSSATQSHNVSLAIDVLYSQLPQTFGTTDSPVPELTEKDEQLLSNLVKSRVSVQQTSTGFQSSRGKANPFD